MSLAHAAEDLTIASSRQLTLFALIPIGLSLALMKGFEFWSWCRGEALAASEFEWAGRSLKGSTGQPRWLQICATTEFKTISHGSGELHQCLSPREWPVPSLISATMPSSSAMRSSTSYSTERV